MKKQGRNILVISAISLLLAVLVGLPACGKVKPVKPASDFYFFATKNDINPGVENLSADGHAIFNISSDCRKVLF